MTPSALPYSGAVSTTAPPCIGSCSRTPCSGAMASAASTSYLLVPTPMTGSFWPDEGMALVTVAPALAARTVREMPMPAPRVRAARSASRRFIRSGVIASLRVARQRGGSGIVHRAAEPTGCGADEAGFPAGNSGAPAAKWACCAFDLWVMLVPMICLAQPDAATIARKATILAGLRTVLDAADVIDDDLLL